MSRHYYYSIIIIVLFKIVSIKLQAQSIAINNDGSTANGSAILDVKSDTKGILLPRMTKVQKNGIASPATGLLVFQTGPDSIGFHYFNGTSWLWLESINNNVWRTTGNTATDTSVNFIGTLNDMPLRFKQNNATIAKWNSNSGSFFIGKNAGERNAEISDKNNIGIGNDALSRNVIGIRNIAMGDSALSKNAFGNDNIAIGFNAGKEMNTNGAVYIGSQAGQNSRAAFNNFIGFSAGFSNTTGSNNNFMGYRSAENNTTGFGNTAFGDVAMGFIKTGNQNSLLGYRSDIGDSFIDSAFSNATAIGALALVDTSNAMVLGSINGINSALADVNVGIGTTKPKYPLHVSRGSSGSLLTNANRIAAFENDASHYIQLLSPNANETGILAGNAETLIKSGIVFTNDSAIQIKTGGNITRIMVQDTGNVGIGNNFPSSKLVVNGSLSLPLRVITSSATASLTAADHTIIVNSAAGSIPLSLPLVTTTQGRVYVIVNQNTFSHTTNFAYRDFTNTPINTIPPNASITLQGVGGFWYRVQ